MLLHGFLPGPGTPGMQGFFLFVITRPPFDIELPVIKINSPVAL
jgi:hypothetical protein